MSALAAVQFGASKIALALWLTCPPIIEMLMNGQLEWLVFAGLLMPPRWGLFFVLIKPQVAGAGAVWWTVEAWRDDSWRAVVSLWWPVALALTLSATLYKEWWSSNLDMRHQAINTSLFPLSVPVGLALLWLSVRDRDWRYAVAASPMLSPYLMVYSWGGAILVTVRNKELFALVIVQSWWVVLLFLM